MKKYDDVQQLIANISQEVDVSNKQYIKLAKPTVLIKQVLMVFFIYICVIQSFLELRADIFLKVTELSYIVEIILLIAILCTSVSSAILYMYPDVYQQRKIGYAPYWFFAIFCIWMFFRLLLQVYTLEWEEQFIHFKIFPSFLLNKNIPVLDTFAELNNHTTALAISTHTVECLICIVLTACIPFVFLFFLLRKGATVKGHQSGLCLAFAACSVGCLVIRLSELTHDIAHLIAWHYLPTLLLSLLISLLGTKLFKW